MIVLGIETATIEVGAALSGPDGLLASFASRNGRRHVEQLHVAVEAVCRAAGVSLSSCDAVGVDVGPGLFTGLRVGVAAAKSFAFALGLPVVGLSSTEVLARAGRHAAPSAEVVPVVDVRRGEVAWALPDGPGSPLTGPPCLGKVSELVGSLAAHRESLPAGGRPFLLVGDGALRYGEEITTGLAEAGVRGVQIAGDELAAPPVAVLAALARERALAGSTTTALDLEALYLRGADAAAGSWAVRVASDGGR